MTAPAALLASLARRPPTAEADAALLGRYVADADPAAFAELVQRYARLVWRVARTRCRTDATAEDVFQATFAVLARKAGALRAPPALAGWLHLTAHRLAVKATRRERPTVPLPHDLLQIADPLDGLTARELLTAVDDELARLTDAERAVLLLCGLDGVSNAEAASRLGCSAGSVKGRLERARRKLRARLAKRGLELPAVLAGVVGFAPPAAAVDAAAALPAGGAVPPAVARLITETFTVKAKTALTAAVAGLLLFAGGFVTDGRVTPSADAAPVPRELKPPPKEAWGEVKSGLQAGLRMPDGATLEEGQQKPIQVVIRNVGKAETEVWYTPQQPGLGLSGATQDGRVRLGLFADINGRMPEPVNVVLKPGGELVRWHSAVRHATPNDDRPREPTEPRLDLPPGTHTLHMHHVGGDIVDEFKPRDGAEAVNFFATNPLALATGELEVRCVPKRPQPRRNAPVPKDAPKAVLWSEPVRVDWKGSGVERINGVWAPDGKSVIVPTPTANEKGEPLAGGGIDFRDATTGTVTKSLTAFPKESATLFQPVKISVEAGGKSVHAAGGQYVPGRVAVVSRGLATWPDATAEGGGGVTVTSGRRLGLSALSPDGKWLSYTSHDALVEFQNGVSGGLLSATKLEAVKGSRITAIEFHSTSGFVVVAYDSGVLHSIESATGKQVGVLGGLDVTFRAVAVSADGNHIAAGGEPGRKGESLIVIDGGPPAKKLGVDVRTFADAVPAKERINGLAFSPDGKHLAAACSDGVLRVFDVKSGTLAVAAKEHTEAIFSVAYSPDGKKLLTVGKDAMKVWDAGRRPPAK